MVDWDSLMNPAREALEALIAKGDDMADRIAELEAELSSMTLDCLAAHGQAGDAHNAQLDAEAKMAKAMEALEEITTCVEDGCYCSEMKMAAAIDEARKALAADSLAVAAIVAQVMEKE